MTVLDLPDAPGPERDALVLKHVVNGDAEVNWARLSVGRVELLVMQDALKLGGARIGAGARLAQQVADALGALLLTPKVLDLMYAARAVTIDPATMFDPTQMLTTHWFEKASARIDAAIAAAGGVEAGGIVQTVGKPWMISNALLSHPGRAENYGWHVPPGSVKNGQWRGVPAYPSMTLPGVFVLQQPGWAHGLDQADYCLAPGTRVLTADLRWIPIETVQVGDELVGFDESLQHYFKLQRADVQSVTFLRRECFEIRTTRGTVIASAEHRWPVRNAGRSKSRKSHMRVIGWVETGKLRPGDMIPHLCDPWTQDTSWDGAWMAGFLDGEGWLSGTGCGFGQNPGPILDRAIEIVHLHGLGTSVSFNKTGCAVVSVCGKRPALRTLGVFRPLRLMAKSAEAWEGRKALSGGQLTVEDSYAEVVSVRRIGQHPVVGVKTSTGTLVAEGLLSHNSETIVLMHRACKVDGADADLASVLLDPTLAPLVSHEGALDPRALRQPGVPIFSCPIPRPPSPIVAARAPGGLCPTPPAPTPTAPGAPARGLNWLAAVLALAGAAAGGGAGLLLARSQGWNRETALLVGAGLGAIAGTVVAPKRQA